MKYKVLLLTVLVTFVQCKLLTKEELKKSFNSCLAEAKIEAHDLKRETFLKSTPAVRKFLECQFKNQGLITDEGFVDYSKVQESLLNYNYEAALAEKLVKSCENVQVGSNIEERVYNAAKCLHDNLKTITDEKKLQEEKQ